MSGLKSEITAGSIKPMQLETPGKRKVHERKRIRFYLFVIPFFLGFIVSKAVE